MVSEALVRLLDEKGIHAQLSSPDALRRVLTPRPTYLSEERDAVYATLVYIAGLLTQNGVKRDHRCHRQLEKVSRRGKNRMPESIEAYLMCPLHVCIEREAKRGRTCMAPRKIYSRALGGKAPTVPAVGQSYEPPQNPEMTLDTLKCSPEECAKQVLLKLGSIERGRKS